MTGAFTLTDAERRRIERIDALVALGAGGIEPLLEALDDPSWTVRRAAIASLAAVGDEAAGPLCDWLRTRRTSEHAIAAAVDSLTAIQGTEVVPSVLRLLHDEKAPVVADGATILGRRGAREAAGALGELLGHPDDNVAVAAIEALGAVGGSTAFDALAELVRRRSFFRTFPAMQVLSASGDPRAVAVFGELLDDPLFRDEAIRALGRTGAVKAIAPLVRMLDSAPLVDVATALADVVKRATWTGAHALVTAELSERLSRSSARFVSALAMAEGETRGALAEVLGWIGDAGAVSALGALLANPEDGPPALRALRQIATRAPHDVERLLDSELPAARAAALELARTREAGPAVRQLLHDEDPEVRALACGALARIGDTVSVPDLFERLRDPSPRVAHAAVAAINSLGSAQMAELAAAAARDPSAPVRRHALRIISYLGLAGAFAIAREAIGDRDPKVVEVAIGVLGTLDEPGVDALLAELANRPEEHVRVAAVRAAATRRNDTAFGLLETALADDSAWVRYHACRGLGQQWHGGSPLAVIASLADPMPQVRIAAIEALAHIPTPEAWQALAQAARSPDPDQERAALAGLGLRDREAALDILLEAARSTDDATRLVALSALAPSRAPRALAALVEAARGPSVEVRDAALSLLAERDDRAAAEALVDLAIAAAPDAPVHAALSRPGAARTTAIAARLIGGGPANATVLAAALARMSTHEAAEALVGALEAPEPLVRRTAAVALAASAAPAAAVLIARMAQSDPDPEVRRVCATLAGG